jgi:hypothetical protein
MSNWRAVVETCIQGHLLPVLVVFNKPGGGITVWDADCGTDTELYCVRAMRACECALVPALTRARCVRGALWRRQYEHIFGSSTTV